jgi:hypothetical protein
MYGHQNALHSGSKFPQNRVDPERVMEGVATRNAAAPVGTRSGGGGERLLTDLSGLFQERVVHWLPWNRCLIESTCPPGRGRRKRRLRRHDRALDGWRPPSPPRAGNAATRSDFQPTIVLDVMPPGGRLRVCQRRTRHRTPVIS